MKKNAFFSENGLKNHTDSQAAGAANSITSMQNWPQARFVRG